MKKAHILKKREAKWKASLPPITSDNADDYPIGNPYKKWTKAELTEIARMAKENREANPMSEETKVWVEKLQIEGGLENEAAELQRKKQQVRRLFFK